MIDAKQQTRDDIFWVIDNATHQPKSVTELFLKTYFNTFFNMYGNTQYMCTKLIKKSGATFEKR